MAMGQVGFEGLPEVLEIYYRGSLARDISTMSFPVMYEDYLNKALFAVKDYEVGNKLDFAKSAVRSYFLGEDAEKIRYYKMMEFSAFLDGYLKSASEIMANSSKRAR